MSNILDPVQAWNRLHPKTKEQIGAAAIAMGVGDFGVATADDVKRWDAASTEAGHLIDALVAYHVVGIGLPDAIDLKPLGIRVCRTCGCTDNCACDGGCHWIEEDLCSACAPGVLQCKAVGS